MRSDWRDGFLFLGNHLALDFLNTRPVLDGTPVELLPDCGALARWLKAAGLLSPREAERLEGSWLRQPACAAMMEGVRQFRERLRKAVGRMEAGVPASAGFVAEVNRLLAEHPYLDQVVQTDAGLTRGKLFAPRAPVDVFAPVVESVASLLTMPDKSRIRKCGSCVLHFYDTSKKGTRRWCSMNTCGNRAKVAAYARRQRAGTSSA